MSTAASANVYNAVPELLHGLLRGVTAVAMTEYHPSRGRLGSLGGAEPPLPHRYSLTLVLSGISTNAALETIVNTTQPVEIRWILRHRSGAEIKAYGWKIDRYAPNQIVLSVATPIPGAITQLVIEIDNLHPLVWDVEHPSV